MNMDEILQYCLLKKGAYLDFPFGDIPLCVKVGNRLFAQIYPDPEDYKITLNCDRETGEYYRSGYPGTVVRGYHCPEIHQPYFNTIHLNNEVSDSELLVMIDHSYSVVYKKLSKSVKEEIINNENN
ncbi:MAG: MmcQ/YjbR family DNA-binding protein [Clostridia bacterium]|nr:MmcQ/YjbR family DNA-binding protein [Clostridia bacterium]